MMKEFFMNLQIIINLGITKQASLQKLKTQTLKQILFSRKATTNINIFPASIRLLLAIFCDDNIT